MLKFCSLYSGSSGNCLYVSSGNTNILIDCGTSCKKICEGLASIDSSIENIEVAYGASGNIKIANCNNLKLLQATIDNNIVVDTDREPKNVNKFDETIFYEYVFDAKNMLNVPFYKRIYRDLYNIFN